MSFSKVWSSLNDEQRDRVRAKASWEHMSLSAVIREWPTTIEIREWPTTIESPYLRKWPSIGAYIFVPCIRECECGATWLGEPDEKMLGLYWWSLFKMPSN